LGGGSPPGPYVASTSSSSGVLSRIVSDSVGVIFKVLDTTGLGFLDPALSIA
jgi:hypothetical protein